MSKVLNNKKPITISFHDILENKLKVTNCPTNSSKMISFGSWDSKYCSDIEIPMKPKERIRIKNISLILKGSFINKGIKIKAHKLPKVPEAGRFPIGPNVANLRKNLFTLPSFNFYCSNF